MDFRTRRARGDFTKYHKVVYNGLAVIVVKQAQLDCGEIKKCKSKFYYSILCHPPVFLRPERPELDDELLALCPGA